jgi:hypothetical protein
VKPGIDYLKRPFTSDDLVSKRPGRIGSLGYLAVGSVGTAQPASVRFFEEQTEC